MARETDGGQAGKMNDVLSLIGGIALGVVVTVAFAIVASCAGGSSGGCFVNPPWDGKNRPKPPQGSGGQMEKKD